MVGGAGLGLDLAEELAQLAPFGMGNPGVRLLVPSARVSDVRTMGESDKHSRFSLHSGAHRALGVAFGRSGLGVERRRPGRRRGAARGKPLERRGRAAGRAARALSPRGQDPTALGRTPARATKPSGGPASRASWPATSMPWSKAPPMHKSPRRRWCGAKVAHRATKAPWQRGCGAKLGHRPRKAPRQRRGYSAARDPAAPVHHPPRRSPSSSPVAPGVLAVTADASRRAALANGATGLARFNGGAALIACHRCGADAISGLAARADERPRPHRLRSPRDVPRASPPTSNT